jgi:hypothetical protein
MQEKAHAPKPELRYPGMVRVCFDSIAPVHLLLRLIRSAEATRGGPAAVRANEFEEGQSYCLVDARIDDETRCATIFQVWPKRHLILGGVYFTKHLEAGDGLAYLEFLRNPKLALDPDAAHATGSASEGKSIDSGLSVLLLADGEVLRSATVDDLTHLTAEQNYVRLHLANGECTLVRGPLQKYEDALPECFIRASRNLIINIRNVQRLRRISRDLGVVYFVSSEQPVRLGRKASAVVRTALMSRSRLPMNRSCKTSKPPEPEKTES